MLNDLAKAAVGIVSLPITLVEDVVTMGGALTDKETPYTVERLEDIMKNIGNAAKPTK